MTQPINLFDYERLAQQHLEPTVWDHYQGGSDGEMTLRACRAAFEHWWKDMQGDALNKHAGVMRTEDAQRSEDDL